MHADTHTYGGKEFPRPGRKRHGGAYLRQGVTFQKAGVDDKSLTDCS
jgi:hypothetical protein